MIILPDLLGAMELWSYINLFSKASGTDLKTHLNNHETRSFWKITRTNTIISLLHKCFCFIVAFFFFIKKSTCGLNWNRTVMSLRTAGHGKASITCRSQHSASLHPGYCRKGLDLSDELQVRSMMLKGLHFSSVSQVFNDILGLNILSWIISTQLKIILQAAIR